MGTDYTMPQGEGAGLRELLRIIRDERWLVYSNGPDHLGVQPDCLPPDPVRVGLRQRRPLFIALCKPDEELTEADRQEILRHDVRMGFTPSGDWQGARAELRQRAGML